MFFLHLMVWTFALWFMFVQLIVSAATLKSESVCEDDDFPYVIKKHDYPEQSPVDIRTRNAQRRYLPFLQYSGYWAFNRVTVDIENNGHTVRVKLSNNSNEVPYIVGGPLFKKMYAFQEIHFHWGKENKGSEHLVNGIQYAIEIHVVHYNTVYGTFENAQNYIDGVCVVAFFGQISQKDNPDMDKFIEDLKYVTNPKSSIARRFKEEFTWIKQTTLKQQYYTYHGSLTTKPFTECVIWIVFTRPFTISTAQLKEFRTLHSNKNGQELIYQNDRPLQSFNNRTLICGY